MSASPTTAARSAAALLIGLMLMAALPATVLAVASNDDRANAIGVTALPFTDVQDTTDATTAADDPECVGNGPTVWYRYDASESLDLQANTFGSGYDTTLSVYVVGGDDLLQIACNDDSEFGLASQVFWTTEPGTTYLLMVGACCEAPGGSLVFNMDVGVPPPPPEPIDVSIDVLSARVSRSTGHVTLDVSLTCSQESWGQLFAELQQRAGRTYIRGYAESWISCGPEATVASLTTSYVDGIFVGGPIRISGVGEVFSEQGYGITFFEESVRARLVR